MAKDVIFENAPKTPKSPKHLTIADLIGSCNPINHRKEPRKFFPKNEIDLDEWFELKSHEELQEGDIFDYDARQFAETNLLNTHATGIGRYYRKKAAVYDYRKKDLIQDNQCHEHEYLHASAILQKGDEFLHEETEQWFPVCSVGRPAGTRIAYRRPLHRKMFTDEELKDALEHYKIKNHIN